MKELTGNTTIPMKYKVDTGEELRNKVMEALTPVTMAAFSAIDVITTLMKAEYNRGVEDGYKSATEDYNL